MAVFLGRRKAVSYGKSRKRLHLDNIFNDEVVNVLSSSSEQEVFSTSLTKTRTSNGIKIRGHQVITMSHGQNPRSASPATADHSEDSSDWSNSRVTHDNGSAGSSILDILDSDEEACAQQLQPAETKRRKITSLKQQLSAAKSSSVQKQDNIKVLRANESPGTHEIQRSIHEQGLSSKHDAKFPSSKQVAKHADCILSTTSPDRKTKAAIISSSASTGPLLNIQEEQLRSEQAYADQEGMYIQQLSPETPRARRTFDSKSQLSKPMLSPGQLGLTSLRLTPEKRHHGMSSNLRLGAATPRRARQRLTERLDAPAKEAISQPDSRQLIGSMSDVSKAKTTVQRTEVLSGRTSATSVPANLPQPPRTKRAINDRSRLTYAKERSHLSDMIDEVGGLKPNGAPQFKTILPQIIPGLLNQEAAVTQEHDDSDDVSAGNVVKSIHELRQAGINNRFERELEALFDDIEPRSSPSKAMRIGALLQLTSKLNGPSFARQFVEIGMAQRLASCAQVDVDTVSAVLLVYALTCLFSLENMSAQHLLVAFHAVVLLAPSLLEHNESFHKLATSRKQNLSKALSRELSQFGQATQIGPFLSTVPWTPQNVALFALEHSLRSVKTLKTVPVELPSAVFNQVLMLLSTECDPRVSSEPQHHIVSAALSILEFSAVSQVFGESELGKYTAFNYSTFADVVANLMDTSKNDDAEIRNKALRVVVSLTNNKPIICDALAGTDLIQTVFEIVARNLPHLSDSADRGDEFDTSTLDSVIMVLGCLLNLADCSSKARKQMYAPSGNSAKWLVAVFNERTGKAVEATTIAQSQVLVAFGYMSMLLCTLCLDEDVYEYVANSIPGKNMTALCLEAEEFLDKLELVAKLNPDDAATSTFNERFRTILVSLSMRMSR